jgi:DNA replication protein|nr:MAG TPA: Replicative helicase [Caudoviricetes sp.]
MDVNEIWRKKVRQLLAESGVPKKYFEPQELVLRSVDSDAWNWLEDYRCNVVEHVKNGKSIVITSPIVGNGKTSWAIRLLQRYIAETALDGRLVDKAVFCVSSSMLEIFGDFGYFETSIEFFDYLNRLKNCDLLVIDEIGSGRITQVSYNHFYDLVNYRVDNNLATIYTTNYNDEQIKDALGERLYSRIYDMSTVIEFSASNVRGYTPKEVAKHERM